MGSRVIAAHTPSPLPIPAQGRNCRRDDLWSSAVGEGISAVSASSRKKIEFSKIN